MARIESANMGAGAAADSLKRRAINRWRRKWPNVSRAVIDYGCLAPDYDHATRWIDAVRLAAIARLALRPGEVVADIACGTGFCLPGLARAVGSEGKVIGIEASGEMLARARARTEGLVNVQLVESPAETVQFARSPDALFFSFAHDVLQSPVALGNILSQAMPGTRVVAVGSKLFPWRLAPRNLWFLWGERGYVTTYRGFARPWRLLAAHLEDVDVQPLRPGNKYLVAGRKRDAPRPQPAQG